MREVGFPVPRPTCCRQGIADLLFRPNLFWPTGRGGVAPKDAPTGGVWGDQFESMAADGGSTSNYDGRSISF